MTEQIEKLRREIEELEQQIASHPFEGLYDRKRSDQLHHKLKKKRRELAQLEGTYVPPTAPIVKAESEPVVATPAKRPAPPVMKPKPKATAKSPSKTKAKPKATVKAKSKPAPAKKKTAVKKTSTSKAKTTKSPRSKAGSKTTKKPGAGKSRTRKSR